MFLIGGVLLMAGKTGEDSIVGRVGVTLRAGSPLVLMFSAVDRKVHSVMIKSRRRPCVFRMAIGAGSRELSRLMIRILSLIVVGLVTAYAGIGCIVIISVMALGAVVFYGKMCSTQDVKLIMNIKRCRHPIRCGRMT